MVHPLINGQQNNVASLFQIELLQSFQYVQKFLKWNFVQVIGITRKIWIKCVHEWVLIPFSPIDGLYYRFYLLGLIYSLNEAINNFKAFLHVAKVYTNYSIRNLILINTLPQCNASRKFEYKATCKFVDLYIHVMQLAINLRIIYIHI